MKSSLTKPVLSVSVRDLVEFVLRKGDLAGSGEFFSPTRMLEGTWGHQQVQRGRPTGYQIEVGVSHQLEADGFVVLVRGRIDGVMDEEDELLIEEIKTVRAGWDGLAYPLHWAQGKIYAHMFLEQRQGRTWRKIEVQLTYLELDSGYLTCFREVCTAEELQAYYGSVLAEYVDWLEVEAVWRSARNESISALPFPFETQRPGQEELCQAVRSALLNGDRLFVEAPTGLGKTMAVLYPAVQAIGQGALDRVFYLTAKTVGRAVAEDACRELRRAGLRWRAVTLTAKEKVCVRDGKPCDVRTCPMAVGYYDRIRPAVREALDHEALTRSVLETVGQHHRVCPFELSLECARWAELIIADYNYVFDPRVYLRRFFAEPMGSQAFLVDEAHNLVDRAREMFSATCSAEEISGVRRRIRTRLPKCAHLLGRVERELRGCADGETVSRQAPEGLLAVLRLFAKEAESWLARNEPSEFREEFLHLYFRVTGFLRTSEAFDQSYVTLTERNFGQVRVRLFCLDPATLLGEALKRGTAAVFFSATLSPLEYFRTVLGGAEGDRTLRLVSPFPPEHLQVRICAKIGTDFRTRPTTHDAVAEEIAKLVAGGRGNYLIYFPSYDYLQEVCRRFEKISAERIHVQKPGMSEEARGDFLREFRAENTETLVGFAVLGGVFGEGIDLVGDRLVGVVVVGVGLPLVCRERELIRDYYQERLEAGFEFAYQYPGMNRVLQAAGRVIRSETDHGVVLLIDRRYGEGRYRELLPSWWRWQWC